MKYLIFLTLVLTVLFPDVSLAASGLVPCDGTPTDPCTACHFVDVGNNVIGWLIGILMLVFAILAVTAGFGLVTSGGNTSAKEVAKSKFTNAFIGLIIVLAGWLIVDTLMRSLLNGGTGVLSNGVYTGSGPWSEIECVAQPTATAGPTGQTATTTAPTATTTPAAGQCASGACVPVGIACSASGCNIDPSMVSRLSAFHAAAGVAGARVTEAMPPSREHRASCHRVGTCIDYSKQGGMTGAEVARVVNAALANGLRPVYEVATDAQKKALVDQGAPAERIIVLGSHISAPHFSIYNN